MEFLEQVPLAPQTTFGLGGTARYFCRAESLDDVRAALAFARENNVPHMVLGGGSNILFSDEGFHGLIIKLELKGVSIVAESATQGPTLAEGSSRSDLSSAADLVLLIAAAG